MQYLFKTNLHCIALYSIFATNKQLTQQRNNKKQEKQKNNPNKKLLIMRTYTFGHQLGTTTIKVKQDGTALFRGKTYSSYNSARRALANYFGFVYLIKKAK